MRRRVAAGFVGALFVLASSPGAASGHHKDGHAARSVHVAGTTDPPVVGEHRFVPAEITVLPNGAVTFSNDELDVGGFGPPHTWTVLTEDCVPEDPEPCRFDTGVVLPGESAVVDLKGLSPGEYQFICTVGHEEEELPFSTVFPPHAQEPATDGDEWTGMVGRITVP